MCGSWSKSDGYTAHKFQRTRFNTPPKFHLTPKDFENWFAPEMRGQLVWKLKQKRWLHNTKVMGQAFFGINVHSQKRAQPPGVHGTQKNIQNQFWDHGGKHLRIKFQWPRSCLSLCKSPTNSAPRNSTLFFGCNPSVAEDFSMGQPPWTLKIPKFGLNKFPSGIIFSGTGSGKKSCQHEPSFAQVSTNS